MADVLTLNNLPTPSGRGGTADGTRENGRSRAPARPCHAHTVCRATPPEAGARATPTQRHTPGANPRPIAVAGLSSPLRDRDRGQRERERERVLDISRRPAAHGCLCEPQGAPHARKLRCVRRTRVQLPATAQPPPSPAAASRHPAAAQLTARPSAVPSAHSKPSASSWPARV